MANFDILLASPSMIREIFLLLTHQKNQVRVFVLIPTIDNPRVITCPATNVNLNGATLNGKATPYWVPTLYWFEWGTSTAYGNSTDLQITYIGLGSVDVSAHLSNLAAGKTYHYRLAALNDAGIGYGEDRTFIPSAPPCPG
ncbi:MAG: hypothetical protein AB1585_04115 [Thermodesulfobacteriota bacterium]